MNGPASRPSSATMKGTRCAISPDTNATSRESRSSLETSTLHLAGPRSSQRGCKLRPAIERVSPLPCFSFDELGNDRQVFGFSEADDRCSLGFHPEARAVLLLLWRQGIGNNTFHTNCIPPFAVCMNAQSEQSNRCFLVAAANANVLCRNRARNAHRDSEMGAGAICPVSAS